MPDAGFLLLINVSIGVLFAASFVGFSRQSGFKLGYWCAAGFVAAALTPLAESFAETLPAKLVSSFSYGFLLTALSCIFIGVWQHYHVARARMPTLVFSFTSILFHQFVLLEAPRDGALHAIGYQLSFAVLSFASAIAILAGRRRRSLDLAVSAVFTLSGIQFLIKSWLAYQLTTGTSTQTYIYSQYALYSQTAGAILSLSLGIGLLALVVSEVYGTRLDRAFRDSLSGLLGRDAFIEAATHGEAIDGSWRQGCFLLADLDRFKTVNDTFGHAAGDMVISTFGNLLLEVAPSRSLCGRFGGEEFAILLPEIELPEAREIARRVAARLEHHGFSFAPDTHFTVSIGMTVFGHREQFSTVLKRADVALYRAKRLGRNRHEIDLPDQELGREERREIAKNVA